MTGSDSSFRLVNAHTHLELSWAGKLCPRPGGKPFAEWVYQLISANQAWRQQDDYARKTTAAIEAGITALHEAGTTHVGDISSSGLSIEPLLASGLQGVVYIEILGLVPEVAEFMWRRAQQMLDEYRPRASGGMTIGLSAHAPYSTLPETFTRIARFCQQEAVPLCIHLAESPAEMELMRHGTGPLYDLPGKLGGDARPHIPHRSPVAYLDELGVLDARPLLVHMIQVSDDDLDRVARAGAKIVHCPRSNQLLQCGRMPAEKIIARAIPLALGTDSLSSSPSLNILDEAEAAISLHHPGRHVTPEQIAEWVVNTAVLT